MDSPPVLLLVGVCSGVWGQVKSRPAGGEIEILRVSRSRSDGTITSGGDSADRYDTIRYGCRELFSLET